MHKVDQTVLDAVGIYEASCEAAGAPVSPGARIAAVTSALATHSSPEEVTSRLMQLVDEAEHVGGFISRDHLPPITANAEPRVRKPRASKGAK